VSNPIWYKDDRNNFEQDESTSVARRERRKTEHPHSLEAGQTNNTSVESWDANETEDFMSVRYKQPGGDVEAGDSLLSCTDI
jgi:hypothetical protein